MEKKVYTRAARKDSETEFSKSAITDHVDKRNHVMDWDSDKILAKEPDHKKRLIKEAMYIRHCQNTMDRDQGNHQLSNTYKNFFIPEGNQSSSGVYTLMKGTAWFMKAFFFVGEFFIQFVTKQEHLQKHMTFIWPTFRKLFRKLLNRLQY